MTEQDYRISVLRMHKSNLEVVGHVVSEMQCAPGVVYKCYRGHGSQYLKSIRRGSYKKAP